MAVAEPRREKVPLFLCPACNEDIVIDVYVDMKLSNGTVEAGELTMNVAADVSATFIFHDCRKSVTEK